MPPAQAERLREQSASSPADLERAEANARNAAAALGVLELEIARSVVRAPFAGVIGAEIRERWRLRHQRQPAADAADRRPAARRDRGARMARYASTTRSDRRIHRGAEPGRTFRAVVDFIDPLVQHENRTIVVNACLSLTDCSSPACSSRRSWPPELGRSHRRSRGFGAASTNGERRYGRLSIESESACR
jgi:hypothetical protein